MKIRIALYTTMSVPLKRFVGGGAPSAMRKVNRAVEREGGNSVAAVVPS